ncbi:MAG TPA: hypothetical protein VGD40_14050 [Chryseosolibacter sp.]
MRTAVLFFVILAACQQAPRETVTESPTEPNDSVVKKAAASSKSEKSVYEKELNRISHGFDMIHQGLKLFRNNFMSDTAAINDQHFKMFLAFQERALATLNNDIGEDADINSLIYADSAQWTEAGKHFLQRLEREALMLRFTEGTPYVEANPAFTRQYFYNHLSSATKEFFDQFEVEVMNIWAEDAGLVISLNELAARIAFWDEFISRNAHNPFTPHAIEQRDTYLYYFLAGMDNTWAFDEEQKLMPEYRDAYNFYLQGFASTKSAEDIREYLAILEAEQFRKTLRIEDFLQKIDERQK